MALAIVLAHGPATAAAARLHSLRPVPLALAAAALLLTLVASAEAWRRALAATGARIRFREAWGCYGAGSLANTFLPAKLGEGVRIGMFASRLSRLDRRWVSGGASLAVGAARAAVYALTCAAAAAGGILPGWALAAPVVVAAGTAVLVATLRGLPRGRLAGFGLVGTMSCADGAALVGWVALSAAARLAGGALVLTALDVPRPVASALVGLTALAVASAVPIAPGGVGVAGAGMALALTHTGVPSSSAIAAALAFHGLETLVGLAFGSSGWIALRSAGPGPGRVRVPAAAGYLGTGSNLYPTPYRVWMNVCAVPDRSSFSRSFFTKTSTVRSRWVSRRPHSRCSSSSRETTRPCSSASA